MYTETWHPLFDAWGYVAEKAFPLHKARMLTVLFFVLRKMTTAFIASVRVQCWLEQNWYRRR